MASNHILPKVEVLRGTCILPDRVPQKLYHYTDLDGLMGIFNTGELWATDVQFMNDTSEYIHSNEMVTDEFSSMGADVNSGHAGTRRFIGSRSALASPIEILLMLVGNHSKIR